MKSIESHIFLENFVDEELYYKLNSNILRNDLVNYKNYDILIKELLKKLDNILDWNSECTKYRVSSGLNKNTSNSKDASAFHKDVYLTEKSNFDNIYTLVVYLDEAELEIIPDSYKIHNYKNLKNPITIKFNPRDALLFKANSLHRGKFEKKFNKSRKIIQIFEIFRNKEEKKILENKILTIPSSRKDLLYVNLAQIYFKIPLLKKYILNKTIKIYSKKLKKDYKQFDYITTEAKISRTNENIDIGNKYRLLSKTFDVKNPLTHYNKYILYPLKDSIASDLLFLILIIILVCLIIIKFKN